MKIRRAVKCANIANQINAVLAIADKAQINGLEIVELIDLIEAKPNYEERGNVVIDACKGFLINALAYHSPMYFAFHGLEEGKQYDLASEKGNLIFDITSNTIRGAGYVCSRLGLEEVIVNVHLMGFVGRDEINEETRNQKLKIGEKRLKNLKEVAYETSNKYGCLVSLIRENNPPELPKSCSVDGILDFDPEDTIRTSNIGIGTNLDFAHLWLYMNYRKKGNGEFPGVDLSKKVYPIERGLEEFVDIVTPSLRLIHMNDARDYNFEFEGMEIGLGDIPHNILIPAIVESFNKQIMGTYEIKDGHLEPECMLRSDKKYREIFGKDFNKYFN